MISILIPVRNYDASELVKDIHRQLEDIAIPAEIIVMNDASDASYSSFFEEIKKLPLASVVISEKRSGAMKARIKLAELAKYNHLLFLDADNKINSKDFLSKWLKAIRKNYDLVSGGTVFPNEIPAADYILCWKYRKERETRPGLTITRNLLIKKSVFLSVNFPEELLEFYGHDDTWLGIQLKKKGIKIKEIKNPCLNPGIDTTEDFIKKSEAALRNLKLMRKFETAGNISGEVKLFRTAYILQQTGLSFFFKIYYKVLEKSIRKNIYSQNPSLKKFDYYRLYYFLSL